MANYHIETRKTSKGETRYRCQVRKQESGKVIYRTEKTFSKKADAKSWGIEWASKLEKRAQNTNDNVPTIRELILIYLNDKHMSQTIGRSKKFSLSMLVDTELAKVRANRLSTHHLVSFCKDRTEAGAKPQTIACDISHLRSVFRSAKAVFNIDVTDTVFKESYYTLYNLNLIGKSEKRSRRPEKKELTKIRQGLLRRQEHPAAKIPFLDILDFSILSCMRIGEICKIKWEDVNENNKTVKVRDRKDPRKKSGNHMYVPMLNDAWLILQRQPRASELVFPYNPKSVTAGFQRVRNELGINDLRYHDLRREGASRLFEGGLSIEAVAQVTGHRNLDTLWQVYTEMNPKAVHDMFNSLQLEKVLKEYAEDEN
ncbi:tyrosine-type recombinase/integrase [Agarivorans sp. B2Z047]|uniref:tyrosine-type recombinase/integrase n=1 Tax=Agarivorans sp. B2Z047 TaxID=2652721 RepID=UPI00128E3B51|nr:site-specific integrase [Agarivorans sp. B2Z047]MPW28241.1 tyrosine-type recombinase/integrase [Agarivorans sp. B2Z047]UQN43930.1 site-specific integrase [Agarivorans sp. B2Z047]